MKPAPFDYLRPDTVDEAVAALGEYGGDARVIAGGQSLIAMLSMRILEPAALVDVSRVPGLDAIQANGTITVGAAATQAALMARPDLARANPLLAEAMPWIGHVQTRNKGTVCGSIAHADPSAELPLCLATLSGTVGLRGPSGAREIPADDFFEGMLTTACGEDEMIEAVSFPAAAPGAGQAFVEMGLRQGDFAIVSIAAIATADGLRIGVGGVADRPFVRDWPMLDGNALDDALNDLAWDLEAVDDLHATARYRRELVRRLGRRAIETAKARAGS